MFIYASSLEVKGTPPMVAGDAGGVGDSGGVAGGVAGDAGDVAGDAGREGGVHLCFQSGGQMNAPRGKDVLL